MIELGKYEVVCTHCGKETEFLVSEVDGLVDDIDDDIADARKLERQDAEAEFSGMVDPTDLPIQPRMIHDLAVAIESGDKFEARILLERIAEDLSLEHQQAAQLGRFAKSGVGV